MSVEILMATYNGGKYIAEQLDSLLAQTYCDFTVLIRDDGSTDDTMAIIERYQRENPGFIRVIEDDRICGSPASNFMCLTEHATADYIMYCDQDDVWLPEKAEVTLANMLVEEERVGVNTPVLVYGSYLVVDDNLAPIEMKRAHNQVAKHNTSFNHILVQNCVTGCLAMLNRRLYTMLGTYSEDIPMHDWWAALCASATGRIAHFDDVVMLYRQHGGNSVGAVNVGSINYILTKIADPETRVAKNVYKRQAELLKGRCYNDCSACAKATLESFLQLYETKSKMKRVIALCQGGFLKSTVVRRLGQIAYI